MATVAALVALAAAGASIAGPSLRPYLAEQLTARFGPHKLIGVLTGTAAPKPKDAVQVDLAAFDQRVNALAQALGQPSGPAADPATLKALTAALGRPLPDTGPSPEARKLAELEGQFAALGARLESLDQRLAETTAGSAKAQGELTARLGAAEQAGTALAQQADALTQRADALAQRADALDQGLAAVRQESAARIPALITSQIAEQSAALAERVAAADRRVAALEERSAAQASKGSAATLLALVSRVRLAMEMSEPFAEEVKTLAALSNGDPDTRAAVEALASVAAQGVANMPRLQGALRPLLSNLVDSERAASATWYAKASSLIFWSQPSSSRADALVEKADGIARDLRGGQLGSALWKLRALEAPMNEGVQAWIVEANRRLTADQALRTLTAIAFKRAQG